jgi:uncharacterized membrane protein
MKTKRVIGILTGCIVMIAGYFFFEAVLLGLFDKTFGYAAAAAELPINSLQGAISAVVGYVLVTILDNKIKL